ncbi:MAG TPA: MFS transporter [Woeseiaceae bacterium]|nr:MFS transporter [Woeseiaceae bacterium]
MQNALIKLSLFINYFVFAILLNSVGTVILQVQNSYGVSESSASVLEAFKDLPIAITSFLVASFIARIGYKRSMLIALGFIAAVCLAMPELPYFWTAKLLFAATGACFAVIKVSVFATLGIVTVSRSQHVSLMNFLESFFMVGVLSGYFIFSAFVNDLDPGSSDWLHVYYLLAALSAAAFLLLALAPLDESSIHGDQPRSLAGEFTSMIRLCAKPLVFVFIVAAFLYVLIEQSIMSWLPSFNSRILLLPASLSIQMASILAASTALGRLLAGILMRHLNWFYVLATGLGLAALLVILVLPLARQTGAMPVTSWATAPLAAFVFPMIGLCIAPIYPAINSLVLSALPARQHAPMAGLIVVFSALGGTTGSIITGNLFEHLGGERAFYFSLLPIALLFFTLYRFKARTDAEAAGAAPA